MKKIQKAIVIDYYVCEVCGLESKHQSEVYYCEQNHKYDNCLHEDFSYLYLQSHGLIEKSCRVCRKVLGQVWIRDHQKEVYGFLDIKQK